MSNVWGTPEPPGFTVQRVTSDGSGGDFVRGLPAAGRQNALRYNVRSVQPSTASPKVAIKSTLTAVASGYGTIDLSWGWPDDYSDWTEVSVVRSGFGHPSTVNDGVTVFRSKRDEYQFFDGLTALTITINDDNLQEGRWYYYTLFFYKTKWEPVMYAEALTPRNYGHYSHLWAAIPEYYRWVDSRFRGDEGHLQQFLKMISFELDLTREMVESWQNAYSADNSPQPLLRQVGLNLGVDTEQSLGEIRTRALIGQISSLYERRGTARGLELVVEAASKCEVSVTEGRNMLLLPDDSEFIKGHGNWVLSELGVPRSVKASAVSAKGVAYTASCSTGSPAVQHGEAFGSAFDATLVASTYDTSAYLVAPYNTSDRAAEAGYGVLAVIPNRPMPSLYENKDLTIACGLGIRGDTTLTPKYYGVPVEKNIVYGFSCQFRGVNVTSGVSLGIHWFDRNELFLGTSISSYPVTAEWQSLMVQGLSFYSTTSAPQSRPSMAFGQAFNARVAGVGFTDSRGVAINSSIHVEESVEYTGAVYAVPFIRVSNREAGDMFKVMGCMFYEVGPGGRTTALAPDYFLTIGSNELIGLESGKVMGG